MTRNVDLAACDACVLELQVVSFTCKGGGVCSELSCWRSASRVVLLHGERSRAASNTVAQPLRTVGRRAANTSVAARGCERYCALNESRHPPQASATFFTRSRAATRQTHADAGQAWLVEVATRPCIAATLDGQDAHATTDTASMAVDSSACSRQQGRAAQQAMQLSQLPIHNLHGFTNEAPMFGALFCARVWLEIASCIRRWRCMSAARCV